MIPQSKPGSSWGRLTGWVATTLIIMLAIIVGTLSLLGVRHARERSVNMACIGHLKEIGTALRSFHEYYGFFPPAYVADNEGKPMHSWRVLLLPFLEKEGVYDQYSFAEPWDGPRNSKLALSIPYSPWVYACPGTRVASPQTNYVAVVGPGTLWPGSRAVKLSSLESNSEQILVLEIPDSGIHWMKPEDLYFDDMMARLERTSPHS